MIEIEIRCARLAVENLQLKGILLQKDFDAAVAQLESLEKILAVSNSAKSDERPDAEAIQADQFGNT